jgi:hypothetical protein
MLSINYCIDILELIYERANYSPQKCARFQDLEHEMYWENPKHLIDIKSRFCGFDSFMYYCLRNEPVFNAFYECFGKGFVFVEAEDYYENGFDGHECNDCVFEDTLFVLIDHNKFYSREHQTKKIASLRLENQLFKFYEVISIMPSMSLLVLIIL